MSEVCAACKKAIGEGEKATRDKKGRHYHPACAQRLMQQRRAQAQQAAPPGEDAVLANLLAGAEKATAVTCPGCGNMMAEGAALCVRCGHNFKTGKSLKTQVEKAPKEKSEKSASSAEEQAQLAAMVVFVVVAGLGVGGYFVPVLFLPYLAIAGLLSLGLGLWALVAAFQMGVGTGLLYIFVPFYALYWLLKRCENEMLKLTMLSLIGASVLVNVFAMTGMGTNPMERFADPEPGLGDRTAETSAESGSGTATGR